MWPARAIMSKHTTMRLPLAFLALWSLFLFSGCGTTVNRVQFAVVPPDPALGRTRMALSDADYNKVLEIVRQRAKTLHLVDRTEASMVPGTLACYRGADTDEPMTLVAWKQEDQVFIDFMQASQTGVGETLSFREAREGLMADLEAAFGLRLKLIPLGDLRSPEALP